MITLIALAIIENYIVIIEFNVLNHLSHICNMIYIYIYII